MKEYAGKMKVAIVAYGHADNVVCLTKALSKYIDVTLIFVTSGDRFVSSIFDWDIAKIPFGFVADSSIIKNIVEGKILSYLGPRIKIYIARTPDRKILKDWKLRNFRYIKQVAEYINNNSYDVVHFNGSSGFQLYLHKLLDNKPKVYTIHDYLPHSGEATFKSKSVNTLLNKFYTKLDYEFIQHHRILSKSFVEFYKISAERVHTVYCGPLEIYRVFSNDAIDEEPNTILFFGRISPYKGLECLLQAVSEIKKVVPDIKLIIAGKGNFWFEIADKGEYEIHNYHIPNEELVKFIQRASVVVAPYNDATHSAVIMTAYAFNKPVVASAVGGIPEVVQDNVTGRLVPPKDSQALASAIIDLLLNSEKREQMKKNIENYFSKGKLSWDYIAEQTLDVYKKAIFRRRA